MAPTPPTSRRTAPGWELSPASARSARVAASAPQMAAARSAAWMAPAAPGCRRPLVSWREGIPPPTAAWNQHGEVNIEPLASRYDLLQNWLRATPQDEDD